MGMQARTETGVRWIQSPQLTPGKTCPMPFLSRGVHREGAVEPLAVKAGQSHRSAGAQGCQKPTTTPGWDSAPGQCVDRKGQERSAPSCSQLVAGSDPLDITPWGPLWGRGAPCLFLPAHLTSPNKEKEVALWPADAQHKGAIRACMAAGETERGSGVRD